MQKKGANISLKGYDDIFSTDQSRAEAQQERVQEIPLSELHPFEGHPFRVVDDEEMMKTAESVRDFGVLTPAIVRPDPDGGYEIVSGHRRHRASELAGKETMPAIVRDLDDDAAIILMVDANLQRESILPSERAFAYSVGITAQETILGVYRKGGVEKIVVACKDFTSPGIVLQDFASLKNTVINSSHNGYGTELTGIMQAMDEQTAFSPTLLKQYFWDVFIVDALIGNWNRHNGNWGFLYNTTTDEISIAPVYDCGSSLYPQADEAIMRATLENQPQRDLRTFSLPLSVIKINNQQINYFDFISSLKNADCNRALKRILPKVNINHIFRIVDETPFISELQKQFYKTMLQSRKERILDFSMEKLLKREKERQRYTR